MSQPLTSPVDTSTAWLLEVIPCAGSRGRQPLGREPHAGLRIRASRFDCGLDREHMASWQWEPAHYRKALSCPATTWHKRRSCSFSGLLQTTSFNQGISCAQNAKRQWVQAVFVFVTVPKSPNIRLSWFTFRSSFVGLLPRLTSFCLSELRSVSFWLPWALFASTATER